MNIFLSEPLCSIIGKFILKFQICPFGDAHNCAAYFWLIEAKTTRVVAALVYKFLVTIYGEKYTTR